MPFRSIIGHRRIVSLLSRAVARETLPPSLLLAGPAGVGKRRIATAIAEAVNCLQPRDSRDSGFGIRPSAGSGRPELVDGSTILTIDSELAERVDGRDSGFEVDLEWDACGECASCRRIARGVHPDVMTITPGESGSIKIEQVRDAIDRAGYRPFEGRRRVVIVDEADALVVPAQNALLKTLEEPPSASIFILVSSMPDSLLATVRSRCPRLRFGALAAGEVAEALMRDHEYTDADAHAAAADADGSIGLALSAGVADLVDARDAAQDLLEQTARTADPGRRLEAARELTARKTPVGAERDQLAAALRALSSLLRDIGLLAIRADTGALANADLRPRLEALTASYDSERATLAYAAVDRALGALERNASPKVVADWLVLQL